jgi:hypothetical protein
MNEHGGVIVKSTNVVAAFGVTLNSWLPSLEETSRIAGLLVPILSAAWLILQMGLLARRTWRGLK